MRKTLVGVLAGACLAWMGSSFAGSETAAVGKPAPAFSLEDQNGNKVSLSDFTGKIVVLEWLNPDCPFSRHHYEAKTMPRLSEKYKDKDVVWLGINSTNYATKGVDADWVAKNQLIYRILDDHAGAVGKLYGAKTTPHMYIVDKSGTLVYKGAIDSDPSISGKADAVNYVEKALDELLSGKPVSTPETKSYGCSVKYSA
jgi:peroxiredoxin